MRKEYINKYIQVDKNKRNESFVNYFNKTVAKSKKTNGDIFIRFINGNHHKDYLLNKLSLKEKKKYYRFIDKNKIGAIDSLGGLFAFLKNNKKWWFF
jgi:hypothetical protein